MTISKVSYPSLIAVKLNWFIRVINDICQVSPFCPRGVNGRLDIECHWTISTDGSVRFSPDRCSLHHQALTHRSNSYVFGQLYRFVSLYPNSEDRSSDRTLQFSLSDLTQWQTQYGKVIKSLIFLFLNCADKVLFVLPSQLNPLQDLLTLTYVSKSTIICSRTST